MAGKKESRVRSLAYRLWQQEGFPEGRELEHWHRARAIIENGGEEPGAATADEASGAAATDAPPMRSPEQDQNGQT